MAIVAMPDTVPYRRSTWWLVPPAEQKIEEIMDISSEKQPDTFDESLQTESLLIDSKFAQEKVVARTKR